MIKVRKIGHLVAGVFLLLQSSQLRAQEQKDPVLLNAAGHYGFIIAHHDYLDYLIRSHIGGFELNYIKPTFGEQEWQRVYRYPEQGITYTRMWLGNPDQLGNLHGLQVFVNLPLMKREEPWLFLKISSGLSYVNKHFHRVDNHKNIAIGSSVNPLVSFRLNTKFDIGRSMRIDAGFGLTHFSNGSYSIPNLGINMVTLNLGLTCKIKDDGRSRNRDTVPAPIKGIRLNLIASGGITEIEAAGGGKFALCEMSLNAMKTMNHKNRLGAGIDLFYNEANIEKFRRDTITLSNNLQNTQLGFKLAWELTISKVSLPFEMGVYALSKYKDNGFIYHRIMTRYQVNDHWNINWILKTHFAKADYFALGLGYRW